MKTLNVSWTKTILFACAVGMLPACNKSSEPMGKGEVEFQITDAPVDDASVKSVFVTVADIKVDGQSVSGFTKQTIDLKAYQAGATKVLGATQLDAKAHSTVTLVLDTDNDASGSTPGCYVMTTDNSKYKLWNSGTIDVAINKGWSVATGAKSTLVVDFDLRKSIRAMADQSVRYHFVSNDNLQTSVRLVSQDKSGDISGTYNEQTSSNADMVIVYAYKKGSFNANTETVAQGDDAIFFKNAISSTAVKTNLSGNTFKLAFLDEGDYELHFAAYNKNSISNQFVFQNMLSAQTSINGSVGSFVTVQSGMTLSITSVITGI
jgi:hypothetical protein